jgi:hypothetical protein
MTQRHAFRGPGVMSQVYCGGKKPLNAHAGKKPASKNKPATKNTKQEY